MPVSAWVAARRRNGMVPAADDAALGGEDERRRPRVGAVADHESATAVEDDAGGCARDRDHEWEDGAGSVVERRRVRVVVGYPPRRGGPGDQTPAVHEVRIDLCGLPGHVADEVGHHVGARRGQRARHATRSAAPPPPPPYWAVAVPRTPCSSKMQSTDAILFVMGTPSPGRAARGRPLIRVSWQRPRPKLRAS